jgi:hypothetical protein
MDFEFGIRDKSKLDEAEQIETETVLVLAWSLDQVDREDNFLSCIRKRDIKCQRIAFRNDLRIVANCPDIFSLHINHMITHLISILYL